MFGIVRKKDTCEKLISEIDLLRLADKVVQKYYYTIPASEREDVKMSIIENFLSQEDKITQRFKGNSEIKTYCFAILNRICCGIIRKELKNWQTKGECMLQNETNNSSSLAEMLIEDEIIYLNRIFTLMGDSHKLVVFLASFYRLHPKEILVKEYDANYIKNKLLDLLNTEKIASNGEIYEILSHVVNIVELKDIKSDAVRMWLNKQIDLVISRLNGSFNRANYDKESLEVLFEYFYIER
ncbi:MAG: hypothetical protein ACEPOZ_12380 [Marinifilaceae bacterium]